MLRITRPPFQWPNEWYVEKVRLRPTLRASHLSVMGTIAIALGIAMTQSRTVAYGAAIIFGVAVSRALATLSIARARSAGFEMLWVMPENNKRANRGRQITVVAELRNRDSLPTRFRNLHISHAPGLSISCSPKRGEIPANGSLLLQLTVRPLRVGYHGIFNITLETIRAPGLFTVPLSFSNPFVVQVYPESLRIGRSAAVGGRTMLSSPQTKTGRRRGSGGDFLEIRKHRPEDPYRRIAWKASARRGELLVIEREQQQSDLVWLVVDASLDGSTGNMGSTQLDQSIDAALSWMQEHLDRGDRVGLAILGARSLIQIAPDRGARHATKLIDALAFNTHTADADRSDWDEGDVAQRVYEHILSLDSSVEQIDVFEHRKLATFSSKVMNRAPVQAKAPWSTSLCDSTLRQYLLSFGIQPPPRDCSDRHQTEGQIALFLTELLRQRKRPSIVYLFGQPPTFETPRSLLDAISKFRRHRTELRYIPVGDPLLIGLEHSRQVIEQTTHGEAKHSQIQTRIMLDATAHRNRITYEDGKNELVKRGAKLYPIKGRGRNNQRPRSK